MGARRRPAVNMEGDVAIKGLTGRGANFPQIGEIRKGAKKPEKGDRPGKDLTYFRIEFEKGEPPETAAKCRALFGDEPKELRIMLPLNRIDSVWSAWIDGYTAGGLVYRSNGNDAAGIAAGEMGGLGVIFWRNPMTGQTLVRNGMALDHLTLPDGTEIEQGDAVPCVASMGHPVGKYETADGELRDLLARPDARLMVMLQGLGRFAYLVFKTTSQHDIANLDAQLEGLEAVQRAATAAGLSGVPLVMRRRPKMVSTPIKKGNVVKRQRMEKWLVSLETDPEWATVKMNAMIEAATPAVLEGQFIEGQFIERLPAPGETSGDPWDLADGQPEETPEPESEIVAGALGIGAKVTKVDEVPMAGPAKPPTAAPDRRERTYDKDLLVSLIKEGVAGTEGEAAMLIGRSPWRWAATPMRRSSLLAWCRACRRAEAEGMQPAAAAEAATAELAELAGG